MSQLCYKCFNEYSGQVCPRCGYDPAEDVGKYPHALQPGTVLGGRYIVGRVLGQGGFGITYAAQDYETKQLVAIKEFLPESIATRLDGTTIGVFSVQNEANFSFGKEKFLAEARTLSQFNGQPCICDIYSYFEENGTAYFAMEYVNGVTLSEYLESNGGAVSVEEAKRLLLPVMKTLSQIHSQGIIHRDIAPDNIMVKPDGSVVLIDFGAARLSLGEKTRSLTVMLKYGFAPREQYARRSRQGPYTDVYAMAATFYYTITGTVPPDAYERTEGDTLKSPRSMGISMSKAEEAALLKGLAPASANRWQTMEEFSNALQGDKKHIRRSAAKTGAASAHSGAKGGRTGLVLAACAAVIVIAGGVYFGVSAVNSKKDAYIPAANSEINTANPASEVIVADPVPAPTETPEPTPEPTPTPAPIVASGSEGSIKWELDSEGVLYILGSGMIRDYDQYDRPGWMEHKESIFYLKMSDSITGVGEYAFADCVSLKEVDFSSNITELAYRSFNNCISLTELDLPDKVEKMFNVFNGCKSLEFVELPSRLRVIGAYCFNECNLQTLVLPAAVEEIQEYAFYGCDEMRDVVFEGDTDAWKVMERITTGNMPMRTGSLTILEDNIFFPTYPDVIY